MTTTVQKVDIQKIINVYIKKGIPPEKAATQARAEVIVECKRITEKLTLVYREVERYKSQLGYAKLILRQLNEVIENV